MSSRRRLLMQGKGSDAIYGVTWDLNTYNVLNRTDASAGFENPVPYVGGATEYSSPFDYIMPWAGMIRSTDSSLGELVAIPKFYLKWTLTASTIMLQISMTKHTGFVCSPAHMARFAGDSEKDVVYVGRYNCCSTYKSTTGRATKRSVWIVNANNSIKALKSGAYCMDYLMHETIKVLYLVEYGKWYVKDAIGFGGGEGSFVNVGYTDLMPYHTGTMKTLRTIQGCSTQYRNIEGLWDNIYYWVSGIYLDNPNIKLNIDIRNFTPGTGGVTIGTLNYTSTAIRGIKKIIPSVLSGYEGITYVKETYSSVQFNAIHAIFANNTPNTRAFYSGQKGTSGSTDEGLFFYNQYSVADSDIGFRLMYIPGYV